MNATGLAEVVVPAGSLHDALPFWIQGLGFRLEAIHPADSPRVAVVSGHGVRLRLEHGADVAPGRIRLLVEDPSALEGPAVRVAPGGTVVEILPRDVPLAIPKAVHVFDVRRLRDGAPWVVGRAGMQYRDLIPSRLGGALIASHIRVPGGGLVPDAVHRHTVGFQLILCHRGWVDVLYEDQGDAPMRLAAGDCVIQPPGILHRVCEASADIEVLELGVPAEHETTMVHDAVLPNGHGDPSRTWAGQRFVHHVAATAAWGPHRLPGFACRETGIAEGTDGVAAVQAVRAAGAGTVRWRHDGDILLGFVRAGSMVVAADGGPDRVVEEGDAWVVPPGMPVTFRDVSADLEYVEASLPAGFRTEVLSAG